MVTVSKSVLKARMLEYFRRVEQTGEELIVTSDGVPVLKIVPIGRQRSAVEVLAELRAFGPVIFAGDPDESTIGEWDDA